MTNFVRETRNLEIVPDEQIRRMLIEQIEGLGCNPESMVLVWRKEKQMYLLEILLAVNSGEKRRLAVGYVYSYEYDALNRLATAGRKLYFRLRKEFPILQRKLSIYQYQKYQTLK